MTTFTISADPAVADVLSVTSSPGGGGFNFLLNGDAGAASADELQIFTIDLDDNISLSGLTATSNLSAIRVFAGSGNDTVTGSTLGD